MLLAMNRNASFDFNDQYRLLSMEGQLKPSAKADPAEHRGDELQPTEYDVLFGRGKPFQDHPGNLRLHSIVNVYKPNYTQARRHEKTAIAEDVVKIVKNDGKHVGRFLKQVDGKWEAVSDIEARAKVSHALRGKSRIESKSKIAVGKSQMQPNLGLNQVGGLESMRQPNRLHPLISQQPNMMVAPFANALSPAAAFMPSGMPSVYQSILLNNIREERDRLILQQLAAGAMNNPLQMRQPQGGSAFSNASRLLENPLQMRQSQGGTAFSNASRLLESLRASASERNQGVLGTSQGHNWNADQGQSSNQSSGL